MEREIQPHTVHDIGRFIRATRKAHGVTQERLCGISGVSQRFLSELENGKETAELGKVLHVLRSMGCDVILRRRQ